ncbi:MAG: type II toxin-antitoxin system HicB family antitoxin [Chloroflexota bacterium]
MRRRLRLITDYAIVVKEVGSGYFAEYPALPGCWSQGSSYDEARQGVLRILQQFLAQSDQLLSQGFYPGLAGEIASWYSWDASWWREWGVVSTPPDTAIRVAFRFEGEIPHYVAELLDQVAVHLRAPYTTEEWDRAAAIVMASANEEAEMEIVLSEAMDNGDLCLRHELWSKKTRRQVSIGHFPFLSSAWIHDPSAGDARAAEEG